MQSLVIQDYIVILIYFIVVTFIGIKSGIGVKDAEDYATGKREFSTFMLLMTFLATDFGAGSTVGDIAKIANEGIIFPISICGFFIFCIYMAVYIAPKFDSRFKGMMTACDIMKHFYGTRVENLTAFIGFTTGTIAVGAQITAISWIFKDAFMAFKYEEIAIITGCVVGLYSTIGGIKSVVKTDALQFIILVIVMPIMAFFVIDEAGGMKMLSKIPQKHLMVFNHERINEYLLFFFVGILPFMWLSPSTIQRFLMTKEHQQISKMYFSQIVSRIVILFLVILIAFSSFSLFPELTNTKEILPNIIQKTLPVGVKGLVIVVILAITMSTADSSLNCSSVLIVHNFIKPIFKIEKNELLLMKIATACIAVVGILIALKNFDIVSIAFMAKGIWGSAISIALLLGVLGMRVHVICFWTCLVCSFFTLIFFYLFTESSGILPPAAAICAGLLGFFTTHFIKNITEGNKIWKIS